MDKVGRKVTVVSSGQLSDMKLEGTIGRKGIVIENLNYDERKNRGYMVLFYDAYFGDFLWFLPADSIMIL